MVGGGRESVKKGFVGSVYREAVHHMVIYKEINSKWTLQKL